MPTLWSQTLIPTARQVPAEAEVPSHRLMLRAGYIHKLGAGVYDYLPLGLRSLRKVMAIIREEMDRAGAVEVLLPTLQPLELWEQTGRRAAYGENLFVVKDRHSQAPNLALGPTHEEVVTQLVGAHIHSYRQLPLTLYQIQTKFRDEYRPRFGVLRSREFQMKDAYSFHLALEGPGGLDETYQKQFDAYCRIFERCGLPYEVVEAESGPIGGSASHEFMVPSPTGEDVILKSDKGNYAANVEKCEIGMRKHSFDGQPTGELEKVHTPDCSSIEDVATFFKKKLKTKLKPQNMLKTLVFEVSTLTPQLIDQIRSQFRHSGLQTVTTSIDKAYFLAVVRGDHDVNEAKMRDIVLKTLPQGDFSIALADLEEAQRFGLVVGYLGPHAVITNPNVSAIFVDPDAALIKFTVTGANEEGYHVKHFNWTRDVLDPLGADVDQRAFVADIRNAADGDPSPKDDGGVLRETKGIEIGHVFKLGCKYTDAMDVTVLDEKNERRSLLMGCYGIGVNRILAAAIEREAPHAGHDDNGICLPASIAPYAVVITPISYTGAMRETAQRLAGELEAVGLEVLVDDRDERPGVKFKDADLIGVPLRITVGEKSLANGQVELKDRYEDQPVLVAVDEAAGRAAEMLGGCDTTR